MPLGSASAETLCELKKTYYAGSPIPYVGVAPVAQRVLDGVWLGGQGGSERRSSEEMDTVEMDKLTSSVCIVSQSLSCCKESIVS